MFSRFSSPADAAAIPARCRYLPPRLSPSAFATAIASLVAPRNDARKLSAESTPRAVATPKTTPTATPVKTVATPSALHAVAAARQCVPRGRSRSAFDLDRAYAVIVAVHAALPRSAATPVRPTDCNDARLPWTSSARDWTNLNASYGSGVSGEGEGEDDAGSARATAADGGGVRAAGAMRSGSERAERAKT